MGSLSVLVSQIGAGAARNAAAIFDERDAAHKAGVDALVLAPLPSASSSSSRPLDPTYLWDASQCLSHGKSS